MPASLTTHKHRRHIVPMSAQGLSHVVMQVFVDREAHQATAGMKGMTVSRANSAA
jgi:hypothetical protein